MEIMSAQSMNMDHLEIVHCPNVPVRALKYLLNTLRRPSVEWPESPLEAVSVYGLVPHSPQEDILWFETNVEHFDN